MPVKTLSELGIPIGISHDSTVTQPLPNIGLYASVTRKTIKGNILGKKEAVDTKTALEFYTTSAAKRPIRDLVSAQNVTIKLPFAVGSMKILNEIDSKIEITGNKVHIEKLDEFCSLLLFTD